MTMHKECERRYNIWGGNPNGYPENILKCVTEVGDRFHLYRQCSRKRGYGPDGLYCKQHAKLAAKQGGLIK